MTPLPRLLTAKNAQPTVRAVLNDAGYTGSFSFREADGQVEIALPVPTSDAVLGTVQARLRTITAPGVTLTVRRSR